MWIKWKLFVHHLTVDLKTVCSKLCKSVLLVFVLYLLSFKLFHSTSTFGALDNSDRLDWIKIDRRNVLYYYVWTRHWNEIPISLTQWRLDPQSSSKWRIKGRIFPTRADNVVELSACPPCVHALQHLGMLLMRPDGSWWNSSQTWMRALARS